MSLILEDHLTDCAKESLMVGASGPAVEALILGVRADPDMQQLARETIARDSQVRERDHLSRWRISLLTRALEHG